MSSWKNFVKGLLRENPVFGLMLGLCPSLAVSSSVKNAIGMGLSATFVLIGSSLTVTVMGDWRVLPAVVGLNLSVLLVACGVLAGALAYWRHARQFESTDDAFIAGHVTTVSPRFGILTPYI